VIKSYLLRAVIVLGLPLLMLGCHRTPSDAAANQPGSYAPGCSGNPYLTKYDCSVSRIQTAAENGDADAQYALGYMYYYGIDTVKDQQTAALWIKRAAEQGQPLAKKAWSLINSGASFNDLHQAAAATRTSKLSGQGDDTPTPSSTIVYQKPEDIMQLNKKTPVEPITTYLPAYNHSDSLKNNKNPAGHDTSAQNKSTHPAIHDPRLASNAQPIVAKTTAAVIKQLAPEKNQHFTVQLMASDHFGDVKSFITKYQLGKKAHYFRTSNQGKPWYMLTYGRYASEKQAENALKHLPQSLKKHSPWVKSFAILEKEVKLQKIIA